jgi:hypothetical protein
MSNETDSRGLTQTRRSGYPIYVLNTYQVRAKRVHSCGLYVLKTYIGGQFGL